MLYSEYGNFQSASVCRMRDTVKTVLEKAHKMYLDCFKAVCTSFSGTAGNGMVPDRSGSGLFFSGIYGILEMRTIR